MECALSYSYCNWYGQLSFLTKKQRSWSWIKLETSMIFISGIISLIIQKNMLCKNKIRVIYFCQFIFLNFFFFIINIFLEGVTATFHPLPSSALTPDHALSVEYHVGRYFHFLNNLNCSTASVILKLPFYKFGKYFSIFPLGFLR